jgi:hypothetical protein
VIAIKAGRQAQICKPTVEILIWSSEAIKLEIPEDAVLSFEVTEPGMFRGDSMSLLLC